MLYYIRYRCTQLRKLLPRLIGRLAEDYKPGIYFKTPALPDWVIADNVRVPKLPKRKKGRPRIENHEKTRPRVNIDAEGRIYRGRPPLNGQYKESSLSLTNAQKAD